MNLFLLLVLLAAAPALAAADAPCEPVTGAPGGEGLPPQAELVRRARSHLGKDAADLLGALDWEQLWWSGSDMKGSYLAPPPSPSGWSIRLASPEPLELTLSLTLEPGACLTIRPYGSFGAEGITAEEGAMALTGPWRVKLLLSVGGQAQQILLTDIDTPELAVAWGREAGRPEAFLFTDDPAHPLKLDLPIAHGTSENTWRTLTYPRASTAWQDVLLKLLTRGDTPPRQREAAVKLLATEGQQLAGSTQSALRSLLLAKRLPKKEAAALDLVARVRTEGSRATAHFTVEGDAPPRLWVDGQELTGWARRDKVFEVGTALHGFVLVRAEWADGEAQSFWAVTGPGVRLHLSRHSGPRQESPPEGERCVALEGAGATWSCDADSMLSPGPLRCGSPAYMLSAVALRSERRNGAEGNLTFVPSLPGRYTFRWHGPHIDGRWAPGCAKR